MFLHQTFAWHDLVVVGLLVLLEGVLSIDNALVLGLLARRLPKNLQSRALTYGLVGAFVFRFIAIAAAAYLLQWRIVKLLGGAYLVYVAVRHLVFERARHEHDKIAVGPDGRPMLGDAEAGPASQQNDERRIQARAPVQWRRSGQAAAEGQVSAYKFWSTVGVIEVTDIAFAVDSILAAIALVGSAPAGQTGVHPKLWMVITGGMLGVVLMRFAAVVFIRLLDRFPRFETSAYMLVLVIGGKLLVDWWFNVPGADHPSVNFHSPSSLAFWIFWGLMAFCFLAGFIPERPRKSPES